MSNPALDEATAKAKADYRAAAEREDSLQAQLDAAKRVTSAFESIYLGYQQATLIVGGIPAKPKEKAA